MHPSSFSPLYKGSVMTLMRFASYFENAFWLMAPVFGINMVLTRHLPGTFQTELFWNEIPGWIRTPENIFRIPVVLLPLVMRVRVSSASQKTGVWLYLAGILIYSASWWLQISHPQSVWSRSLPGFMAPAYTPILWLTGMGLMGDSLTIPKVPYSPWIYFIVSGIFALFHSLHARHVYMVNF